MLFSQNKAYSSEIIISNGLTSTAVSNFVSFSMNLQFINNEDPIKVTIKNKAIDAAFWTSLGTFLENEKTPKCQHLSFDGCTFPAGFQNLHMDLPDISITNSKLTDECLEILFHYLNPYYLSNLNLSNNELGKNEEAIREVFRKKLYDLFGLSTLNLSGNPIKKELLEELQENLKLESKNTKIIHEKLESN